MVLIFAWIEGEGCSTYSCLTNNGMDRQLMYKAVLFIYNKYPIHYTRVRRLKNQLGTQKPT